jgi:hypothetical protein
MSYEVKDKVYENRWVFGGRIKFERQRAIVEDRDIGYFKALPQDFEIGVHIPKLVITSPEEVSVPTTQPTPDEKPKKSSRRRARK